MEMFTSFKKVMADPEITTAGKDQTGCKASKEYFESFCRRIISCRAF